MRDDQVAIREAQRNAYKALTAPEVAQITRTIAGDSRAMVDKRISANKHYVPAKLTTAPAMLIQEQALVNTTQNYSFDFSINGPGLTAGTNNNVKIAKNDIHAVYGIQLLLATGSVPASMVYRSHGVLAADNCIYNSTISVTTEASKYIDYIEGQMFREFGTNSEEYYGTMGLVLVNPIRIVSGELGRFTVTLAIKNAVNTLTLSSNTLVSMRLWTVAGQAQG